MTRFAIPCLLLVACGGPAKGDSGTTSPGTPSTGSSAGASTGTPSTGTPSTGTPSTGTPSTGTPSTGTPSTGTPTGTTSTAPTTPCVGAASGVLYGVRDEVATDTLVAIDPLTLAYADVGPLDVPYDWGELAWACDLGVMFLVDGRQSNALFTVDRATAQTTLVGVHGVTDLFGLAYVPGSQVLYGLDTNGALYALDRATGAATSLGDTGAILADLAYDAARGQLLAVGYSGDVVAIDPATAVATELYAGASFVNDHGTTWDAANDLLWTLDRSGNLFTHDPAQGYAQVQVATGLGSHDGLTFVGAP